MPDNYRLVRPGPNPEPIFPIQTLDWRVTLTTQIGPLDPNSTSSPPPLFIGKASDAGAIVESVRLWSKMLYVDPYGGGAGAGGAYGLGTPADPVILYFYSKRENDDRYEMMRIMPCNTGLRGTGPYPYWPQHPNFFQHCLPHGQQVWRLAPRESLYVLMNKAIGIPGADLFVDGGNYYATPFRDQRQESTTHR
jgi:hypothetical protein